MRTIITIFREKEFWSGAFQIAVGLYLAIGGILLTLVIYDRLVPFID